MCLGSTKMDGGCRVTESCKRELPPRGVLLNHKTEPRPAKPVLGNERIGYPTPETPSFSNASSSKYVWRSQLLGEEIGIKRTGDALLA